MSASRGSCAECGALQSDASCIECFHALLAFENEHPPAFGAVHHLTVACYYLQHPTGYAAGVLDMWKAVLADSLSGRATVKDLLRRASQQFEGKKRVREPGAMAPAGWPVAWPMTVRDVIKPYEEITVEAYIGRAMAWARTTSDTLSAPARELPRR